MFQIDWAQRSIWAKEAQCPSPGCSRLNRAAVNTIALLHWEEHCHECAIPMCYSTCALYVPRADGKCSRFRYGIYPNPDFQGLLDFGADVRFRCWGKLETRLYGKSVTVWQHRLLDRANRSLFRPAAQSNGALAAAAKTFVGKVRNKYFTRLAPAGEAAAYDEFILECFSPEIEPFRIVLEYWDGEVKARRGFPIQPGWNFHRLAAEAFRFGGAPPRGKLTLSPENNAEKRLVFTWLDLVRYREPRPALPDPAAPGVPAAKVKCVAWDLDNTLWHGILAEDAESRLIPRPEALALIRNLDEKGILQTIISKNNFTDAWPVVERLGLCDYFLYPAINWQPKSVNLKEIASKLNLNPDAFALIDDSPFERAEVQSMLPQVRVYAETEVESLLRYTEFDVPASESTRQRRVSYLTEIKRDKERENFGADYEAFLRSCGMKLRLFVPREERHILRCLELIQRSNQLNLSNTRYSPEGFRALLSSPEMLCVAMECEDRFGDYGIVGFASVDEGGQPPVLHDLVLSCRVAQKRVEHAFIGWLAGRERARGSLMLAAKVVKTERNQPIRQVLDDLRFSTAGQGERGDLMELPVQELAGVDSTVMVETEAELEFSSAEPVCAERRR
jgi:FkbH-like protein